MSPTYTSAGDFPRISSTSSLTGRLPNIPEKVPSPDITPNAPMKRSPTTKSESAFFSPTSGSLHLGEEESVRIAVQLFSILDQQAKNSVLSGHFLDVLDSTGLKRHDVRLEQVFQRLDELGGLRKDIELNSDQFIQMIQGSTILINRAIQGKLIVPNFPNFCEDIANLHKKLASINSGKVATYIPELAQADPSLWSVAVVTIDGQELAVGDHDYRYCVQSCAKPISYLIAAEENGFDFVHEHIGREPSGTANNQLHLKDFPSQNNKRRKVPHNPMINAGGIMSSALIGRDKCMADRFDSVIGVWNDLVGSQVQFSNCTYLSEKETSRANRNWCLGYMMQEYGAFPEGNNLRDTLDLYWQQCAIEVNTRQMAALAATLANGGTNPQTGARIFDSSHLRNCLSLMLSSGMHDSSGEWGFNVGLPAKSGVAGCIFVVVPNKMGIASFSPALDGAGNSVRGVAFYSELVNIFNFHQFDNLRGVITSYNKKHDPTKRTRETNDIEVTQILFASAHGDLNELQRLNSQGADLFLSDYDFRTGMHLAACEGHLHVIKFYVMIARKTFAYAERSEKLSPRDRWGRTPLDDAVSGLHDKCSKFLRQQGATRGAGLDPTGIQFAGILEKNHLLESPAIQGMSRKSTPETI